MVNIVSITGSVDERVVKICNEVAKFLGAVKIFPIVNPKTNKFLLDKLMTWTIIIRPSRRKRSKSQEYEIALVRINAYTGHVHSVIPLPTKNFEIFIQTLKQAYEEFLKIQPPEKVEKLKKELKKLTPEERKLLLKELMKE